jgi:hypothetical protein
VPLRDPQLVDASSVAGKRHVGNPALVLPDLTARTRQHLSRAQTRRGMSEDHPITRTTAQDQNAYPLRQGHCLEPAHPTGSSLTSKPMGYLSRLKFPAPATVETWVSDAAGDPVLVVMAAPGASLAMELRRLLPDLRRAVGDTRRSWSGSTAAAGHQSSSGT